MPVEVPIKALLCALVGDGARAVEMINRLQPDMLCFFAPEQSRSLIEQEIHGQIAPMPRRWDWVVTPDPHELPASYQALARGLQPLLETWGVQAGELVMGLADPTPAMAGALALAGLNKTSRIIQLVARGEAESVQEDAGATDGAWRWVQSNPWDETASVARRDACELFNRGEFRGAAYLFRQLEQRVSGGQKPLYHALADMADGYGLWSRFQHRPAWDKLKTAHKALEMAALWGGPPELKSLLPLLKANAGFLERLAMDPQEVKEYLPLELLGQAIRLATQQHDPEVAMRTAVRALECAAQWRLFKRHQIKSWDVRPEQLPEEMREACRNRFLDDLDGKYKLPLHAQLQVLAGRDDEMGKTYLVQWPKMKPLLDAADHAVLGHGCEAVKPERFQQLFEAVVKVIGVPDISWPKFPNLNL